MNAKVFLLLSVILALGLFSNVNVFGQNAGIGSGGPPFAPQCFQITSYATACVNQLTVINSTHWLLQGTLTQTYTALARLTGLTVRVYVGNGVSGPLVLSGVLTSGVPVNMYSGQAVNVQGEATAYLTVDQANVKGYFNPDTLVTVNAVANACLPKSTPYFWWHTTTCIPIPSFYTSGSRTYTVAQLEWLTP